MLGSSVEDVWQFQMGRNSLCSSHTWLCTSGYMTQSESLTYSEGRTRRNNHSLGCEWTCAQERAGRGKKGKCYRRNGRLRGTMEHRSLPLRAFLPACQLDLTLSRYNCFLKADSLTIVLSWFKSSKNA